jgi:hypothetical protein
MIYLLRSENKIINDLKDVDNYYVRQYIFDINNRFHPTVMKLLIKVIEENYPQYLQTLNTILLLK